MKVKGDVKAITVTQAALAKAIGVTRARVNQMVKEEIFIRNDNDQGGGVFLFDSLKNYFSIQNTSKDSDDDVDYMKEKAKHEAANRKLAELKLAKAEHSVYDATTVEMVMTEILSTLRSQLLGLPSKLAPQLENKSKEEIYDILTREIEDKLSELSEYSPDLFTNEEVISDEEDSE